MAQFAPEAHALKEVPQPAALNRNWIKDDEAENIKGLGWARNFYDQATQAWAQVNKLRTTARPEMTATAHKLEVNKAWQQASKKVGQSYDQARDRLRQARESYQSELELASGLDRTGPHDAELRSVLRSLPERKRYQALLDAIEQGDQDAARAAFTAPPMAVGIERDKLANLRTRWQQKAAPEIVANLQRIDKADAQLTAGIDSWLTDGERLAYQAEIRQAEQAQKQAAEIGQGFQSEGEAA